MLVKGGILIPVETVTEVTTDRSITLSPGTSMVMVVTNLSALTIRLPQAGKSADCFVGVLVKGVEPAGTITVTVVDAGDTDMTVIELTEVYHYVCLYCDGLFWYPVSVFNS